MEKYQGESMNVCLYSPYVPKHIGGGEKYFFDVAQVLAEKGNQVSIAISHRGFDPQLVQKKYELFLNRSLKKIQFIATPLGTNASFFDKLLWTKKFDLMYYLTDGSLFFSLAKKNILHIQFPFKTKKNFVEKLKLKNWQVKNTNSEFTKKVIEANWHIEIPYVHQPSIDTECFQKIQRKEKIILHVGRFFQHLHAKRQDVLVEIFREMYQQFPKELKDWQLILVGSVEDEEYAQKVQKMTDGLPITLMHKVKREELMELYKKASIYWHATGFGIDELKEPEKTEHFGISTAEAMASGCAPVVVGKGGQVEVLGSELKELLWHTRSECIVKTIHLIQHPELLKKYQHTAQVQAEQFQAKKFRAVLREMISQ
jgi:glycosyltransferase involved in cell wall biosynthesis